MQEIKYFSKNKKGFSVDDISSTLMKKWFMDDMFFRAEWWKTRFEIITWINSDKKMYYISINFWQETIKTIKDSSIVQLREKLKKEMESLGFDSKDKIEINNISLESNNKRVQINNAEKIEKLSDELYELEEKINKRKRKIWKWSWIIWTSLTLWWPFFIAPAIAFWVPGFIAWTLATIPAWIAFIFLGTISSKWEDFVNNLYNWFWKFWNKLDHIFNRQIRKDEKKIKLLNKKIQEFEKKNW